MSCEICIGQDIDIDELVEALSDKTLKARKAHICGECREAILPGQHYNRYVAKWEGKIETYRTCLLCQEIRRVFTCGESWMWGSLWDDMREIAFPELTTATDCFQELSPAAKQFVLTRWAEWKGLR